MGSRVESPSGPAASTEVEGLTGAQLEALASIWKREGRQLTARFGGSSMEPTIPCGAEVLLRCGTMPDPGDIAVFTFGDRIMVHRVVARSRTRAWILTRGDANAIPDPPLRETALIGTVVRVWRGGRYVEPAPPPASLGRRLALAICLLGLRSKPFVGQHLIALLWSLRRWFVLAPRALVRSVRCRLSRRGA